MRQVVCAVVLAGCGRFGFGERDAGSGDAAGSHDAPADARPDAPPRANRAFVFPTPIAANFGGLAAADSICMSAAQAAVMPGTFIALLGDSTHTVGSRLVGSRGWVDTAGLPIVDGPDGWLDGSMFHPLRRDAAGTSLDHVSMWGGDLRTCADWTNADVSVQGSILDNGDAFGDFTVSACNAMNGLVCVEIGHVFPVAPVTVSARRAFVTDGTFTPGGGITSADAFCQADATMNGLTGTYLAALATSSGEMFARFSLAGPTWARLDGVQLSPSASDFANSQTKWLETFALQTPGGSHYPYSAPFTGTVTVNCNDWTATTGATARIGDAAAAYFQSFRSIGTDACTVPRPLLCFEQ